MTAAAPPLAATPAWLRSQGFDLRFIVGIAGLGLVSGWAVVLEPRLFAPLLLLDLWLLGYHHVISTFTRLCFDRDSFREHRFLVLGLPLLVFAGCVVLAGGFGGWALATTYLYWQWFHYTRQSWGVSQVYRRKAGGFPDENEFLFRAAFYGLPLWGILHRSFQAPETYLGMDVRVLPVPGLLVDVVGTAAVAAFLVWLGLRLAAWRRGELPVAHTLYVLSHFAVFAVGYLAIDNMDHGWLVINVWHNAQYIAFVWMFNNQRFGNGVEPRARLLSGLSQRQSLGRYLLVCFGISTALYLGIQFAVASAAAALVAYQAINFHHYIVDGLIWKVRKKSLQQTLGIAAR